MLAAGRLDAALVAYASGESGIAAATSGLACVYHAMQRNAESDAALARATKEFAERWAYGIAEVHAYRGDIDQAFTWLDRAYRQKDVVLYRMKGDPLLQESRSRPALPGVPGKNAAAGVGRDTLRVTVSPR